MYFKFLPLIPNFLYTLERKLEASIFWIKLLLVLLWVCFWAYKIGNTQYSDSFASNLRALGKLAVMVVLLFAGVLCFSASQHGFK